VLIGVNLSHDYAHCVLDAGRLSLIEEERRSRRRYHWDDSSYTLACLDRYELDLLKEVDAVFLNSPHTAKIARRDGDLSSETRTYRWMGGYPGRADNDALVVGHLEVDGISVPAAWVSHYHAHAAATCWPCGWDAADVLCLDGGGDYGEGAVFSWADGRLTLVSRLMDTQLGSSYHHFSLRVFDAEEGFYESKVMAIAAFGRRKLSDSSFLSARGTLVPIDPAVRPSVHDVAAFQQAFEDGVLEVIGGIEPISDVLCLAGGCFYNVPLNRRVADAGTHSKVYIPPHAGDMGTAIGAALIAAMHLGHAMPDPRHAASPYLGDNLELSPDELRTLVDDVGDVPVFHGLDEAYVWPYAES
jgi:carbamoyltransferase